MKRVLPALCLIFAPLTLSNAALPDFTDLIKATSPAVVKINVTATAPGGVSPFGDQQIPDQFREFFDRFYQSPDRQSFGVGSGFIISEDGYVVTNAHVVAEAEEIRVRIIDRREYSAEIIGVDERSDLALLKIDASDLPTVRFADPDSLDVGDWVLAIGSPFDLDYSASAGIVSAIGRSLPSESGENYVPFIQTDVAINPGNSGGPLFNLDGEVVGINSQIFTRSGGYMGLSFAIPVNVANTVLAQLRESGSVSRGWLGVLIQEVTADLAKSFQLEKPVGALVSQVVAASPAEQAGLRPGDIIIELDDRPIAESSDLPHVVGLIRPGTEVTAKVMREGQLRDIDIRIGELADRTARAVPASLGGRPSTAAPSYFGLVVAPLDDQRMRATGVEEGVIVSEVAPDSAADRAGLAPGDVIVQLGFTAITDPRQFGEVAAGFRSGSVVPIRFYQNGSPVFRTLQVD